ncbi:MAG: thymidine phosphorylase [Thermoanaerobaculia bacterium]
MIGSTTPYEILDRKRRGGAWSTDEIQAAIAGSLNREWSDAQLGAFLMAAAIQGLDEAETAALTQAMLHSGEQWDLARDLPHLGDKHSTGGVGDKVSLVLGPLLAACGQSVVMLTGRSLGHTGGTADKLETIPGLDLALDRRRAVKALERTGLAIGLATDAIAPADRRLYALRDATGTVATLPLMVASILSKKLACGAAAMVFDVKTGDGAFLADPGEAEVLARVMIDVCGRSGRPAAALVTDMSQPLGRWAGGGVEVAEALACLAGEGPEDLRRLTLDLGELLCQTTGSGVTRVELEAALADGRGRERLARWAVEQGADPGWADVYRPALAPHELIATAPRDGVLARVGTRELGLLLAGAAAGAGTGGADSGVALESLARLGDRVSSGQPLARLHAPGPSPDLQRRLAQAYVVADGGEAPPLVRERFLPPSRGSGFRDLR